MNEQTNNEEKPFPFALCTKDTTSDLQSHESKKVEYVTSAAQELPMLRKRMGKSNYPEISTSTSQNTQLHIL